MKYKTRLNVLLYGAYILEAMALDELLHQIKLNGMTGFSFDTLSTYEGRELQKDLDYLVSEQLLTAYNNHHYEITKKGELKLAAGGFKADAKKSKNALYAFRISLVAITISIIHFLFALLSD